MIKRFLLILVASLPLFASTGCSVNPATGEQSFTAFMSRSDEMAIGRRENPKILKKFGGRYENRELASYVRRVGMSLVRVSETPKIPYVFTVLNDDVVNAFALPGGYVYITRGVLALADNEAEMAGVLAHEIGHVTARHTAQRYSRAMATSLGLKVLGAIGVLPPGSGNIISFGTQAVLQGYSRDQESEADMLGVRYLGRAGYDPNAMVSFFRKLKGYESLSKAMAQNPNAKDSYSIMSSHPRTEQRIAQAIALARVSVDKNPRLGRESYLSEIDGLVFGDDLKQGVRRGRVFSHPGLGIRFEVPPGFVMFNSAKSLIARGPDGAAISFDMASPEKAAGVRDLRRYLVSDWGRRYNMKNVERIEINSMSAVTGATRRPTRNGGTEDMRLVAIRGDKNSIFRFIFLTPTSLTNRMDEAFRRTTYSFRRMSKREVAELKPLRIRIINVKPGDTVKSLSAKMPIEKFARQWFELLNGLHPGQPLAIGREVKIVAQ